MNVKDVKKCEFVINGKNVKVEEFKLEYKEIEIEGKGYQTIVSLPFNTKSSFRKTSYKDEDKLYKHALNKIQSKLNQKYKDIQIRNYNSYLKFELFKKVVKELSKKDSIEISKKEYSNFFHLELHEKFKEASVSNIWDEWEKQFKEQKIKKISDFNKTMETKEIKFLSEEKFCKLLLKENCAYCGISIKEINQLSNEGKLKTKRFRGYTLEIDQKNAFEGYSDENCVACCYWCNNAKTDEFSVDEFREIAKGINKVWKARKNRNRTRLV